MTPKNALIIVVIVAVFTFFTRLCPFLLFRGKNGIPKPVKYLGDLLPPAIMAILVVYCLKSVTLLTFPFGFPELIAVLAVTVVHIIKRNTLLSIGVGTVLYMILIQYVFV